MPITRFEDYIADRFDTMKIWVEFLGEIFITVKKQKLQNLVFWNFSCNLKLTVAPRVF